MGEVLEGYGLETQSELWYPRVYSFCGYCHELQARALQ